MDINNSFKVGIIARAHGLKGEVTVLLDEPLSLAAGDPVFVSFKEGLVPYFIDRISGSGRKSFVKFEDVHTADEASALSGKSLYLPKSARPALPEGSFYDDEVIAYEVVDQSMGPIGRVSSVVNAGPNRMLAVSHHEKEVLIPLNGPFIIRIVPQTRTIHVDLPDGFLTL